MYEAIDIANYTASKCLEDNFPITNLKLQKILYYIQESYLHNRNIAFLDDIEAWQFGPVIPNVYYYFCGFGASPINMVNERTKISKIDSDRFDAIIDSKRRLNPWDMVSEIQKKNGAWDIVYRDGFGNHQVIPNELVK